MAERSDRTERNLRNEGNDNQQVTNRNRRGSISEWRTGLTEELRESQPEENVIHWSWDDVDIQHGVHPADATANDKTLAEWISITENKDLFREPGEEDAQGETLDNWMNQISNQALFKKNRKDDDDDENNEGGVGDVAGAGHRIGSSSTYVSGTSNSGNTRSSNSRNRNTSGSNNTSSRKHTIDNAGTNRNSSGNVTEDSTIGGIGENIDIHMDKEEMKQEENRIFHDWLKRTENPDLYKKQNDEEDDAEYQQMIKYIDLESAGTLIWEKFYAQTLASELDKTNKKKRKKVYSLFNNNSDCEEFASPKKKSGYSFLPANENDTDITFFEKEDINKTPSMFEIRNHETNYFENFPENTVKNRESSGVNKSTDSFVSDSSIASIKTKRCQKSKNAKMAHTDMAEFFNANMTYETAKKFLKYKMNSDKKKDVGVESTAGSVRSKKKKEKKREKREKREDQPFCRKGKRMMDSDKFSPTHKQKGGSSYYNSFLQYTDTKSPLYNKHTLREYDDFHRNSETEITPATPRRN